MDIKQMLNDTVDQQNHARWTGSLYAMKDTVSFMVDMGLDQYAEGLNKEFYWRKHARLQVFMAREYDKQNPREIKAREKEDNFAHLGFNGGPVNITNEILDRLEEAIAISSDPNNHDYE